MPRAGLVSLAAELSRMNTRNWWSTISNRAVVLAVGLALASCSGGSGSGGSVDPPLPPPLDPAKFQVTLGGVGNDWPVFVAATERGGALIVGATVASENGDSDVWLVETDELGTIVRQRTSGGSADDVPTTAAVTPDGGLILVVSHQEATEDPAYELIALDSDWNERWRVPTGAAGVRALDGGDVLVASRSLDPSVSPTPSLERRSGDGTVRWRSTLDGWPDQQPTALAEGLNGDLYLAGGLFVSRLSAAGETRWTVTLHSAPPSYPESFSPAVTGLAVRDDGSLVGVGYTVEVLRDVTYTPMLLTVSADGETADGTALADVGRAPLLAIEAESSGDLTVLGSYAILHASWEGDLLSAVELPFEATAFAKAPNGRFVVGKTVDFGRGQQDVLLAKLDAHEMLGAPPASPSLPVASSFGAAERIAEVAEPTSYLWLLADSDASSAPLVVWSTSLSTNDRAAIESARRVSDGRWEELELAPENSGGQPAVLASAGTGRALAVWLTDPFYGALTATDLDPRAGWNPSFTLLGPELFGVTQAVLPSVAANAHGQSVAVWSQWALGSGVLAARWFEPTSRSWTPAVALPHTIEDSTLASTVAVDAQGNATVVKMGPHELRSYRATAEGPWQDLGPFATETDPMRWVKIAPGSDADVLLTWTVNSASGRGLRTVWLRDGRPRAPAVTLDDIATLTAAPILSAVDSDGRALLVWVDGYTVHARESAPGQAWSAAVPHPDEAAQGASLVGLAPLGHGEFLVSWFERRGNHDSVWASRYHAGGKWGPAEYLGDAFGNYAAQTGGTVIWLAPTSPGTALVARTAR